MHTAMLLVSACAWWDTVEHSVRLWYVCMYYACSNLLVPLQWNTSIGARIVGNENTY